jgi:hypothetical protein
VDEIAPDADLARLLAEFAGRGGVLDYVFLRPRESLPRVSLHRAAALAGMAVIACRSEAFTWDEMKLAGDPASFEAFWGNDDAARKRASHYAWTVPTVDGYKTAFFQPPYTLSGSEKQKLALFNRINAFVLGPDPRGCEIFSWGTDWSDYFDAGKEWWGTFFWTVRRPDSSVVTAIGASSTD